METVSFARVVLDEPGFNGISAQPERLAKVPAVSAATNKPYAQAGLTTSGGCHQPLAAQYRGARLRD